MHDIQTLMPAPDIEGAAIFNLSLFAPSDERISPERHCCKAGDTSFTCCSPNVEGSQAPPWHLETESHLTVEDSEATYDHVLNTGTKSSTETQQHAGNFMRIEMRLWDEHSICAADPLGNPLRFVNAIRSHTGRK
jgi:hypothetical protein